MAHLILAGVCLALTVLIHQYTAVALGLAYFIVALTHWNTIWRSKLTGKLLAVMTVSGVIGVLPIGIGLLTVGYLYTTYVGESIQSGQLEGITDWISVLRAEDPFLLSTLGAICVLLLCGIGLRWIRNFRRKGTDKRSPSDRNAGAASFFLVFLSFYLLYRSTALGLPVIVPEDRSGVYFALLAAAALGVALHYIFSSLPWTRFRAWLQNIAIGTLASGILISGNLIAPPVGDMYQYDDSVKNYLQIKRDYPMLDWTIISPMEENPLVDGYGWHTQLWEVAQAIEAPEDKEIKIPTSYVFLFVEKIPLGSDTPVTAEEATAPFPFYEGSDTTDYYYRDIENRRVIQSKVYHWAEAGLDRLPMSIYYDSPVLRVYRIDQHGDNPYDLLRYGK